MAIWTTPVTNRTSGSALMTYNDMNRITGNVAYLQEYIYGSPLIPKTSWTRNDIIERQLWVDMIASIAEMANMAGATIATLTNNMHYENINNVESACKAVYDNLGNIGIDDFLVYGTSVVNSSNVAKVKESDFLSAATRTKWQNILGG